MQYNPDAACGTKAVYIRNQPTASLYTYTPYTPNAAAPANLGGTGNACSWAGTSPPRFTSARQTLAHPALP
jgi:hypothetical protein